MSEKLKRCPFCGSTDIRECFGIFPELFCGECEATIYEYDIREDLIKLWNTRPIEDELNKRIAELEAELNLLKQERDFWNEVYREREDELGWIPVSERLPEHGGQYLVVYGKYYRDIANYLFAGIWACCYLGTDVKVTHWRELPALPGGEG